MYTKLVPFLHWPKQYLIKAFFLSDFVPNLALSLSHTHNPLLSLLKFFIIFHKENETIPLFEETCVSGYTYYDRRIKNVNYIECFCAFYCVGSMTLQEKTSLLLFSFLLSFNFCFKFHTMQGNNSFSACSQ